MEHKTVPAYLKQVDEVKGIVECIFAVFGNIDAGDDIIHPGAFKKTLSERQNKVRVLDQHNTGSISCVLGKPLKIREISGQDLPMELKADYPNATGGVWAKTQFFLDTPEGKGAFIRLKEGGIDEWSFGYDAVDVDFTQTVIDDEKHRIRNLRQVKLFEYSPVLWGMNQATSTLDAKESEEAEEAEQSKPEQKAVTPYQNLDLAARDRTWDSDAAEGQVREWAGGADDMDWQKYRRAFLWYDADEQDKFGSYKLPYADIVGGELVALPRGIFAAAGSLQGARGEEPDISEADAERVKKNIDRYYAKMRTEFEDEGLIAPWNKEGGADEGERKGEDEGEMGREEATDKTNAAVSFTFNMPDGFGPIDFEKFEELLTASLRSVGVTVKEEKGKNVAKLLNDRIDDLVTDERPQSEIVAAMGREAGITAGTVNQILNGDIDCPTEPTKRGFAEALDIPLSRINSATEQDGCTVGEEAAADDPGESKGDKGMGGSRLGDVLQGNLHFAFTSLVDKWYIYGSMNRDERLLLSSLIGDALDVLDTGMTEDLAGRDVSHGPLMADCGYGYYGRTPEMTEKGKKTNGKAGRMLSARNAQKIQAALAQLHEILMEAGMLPEPDEASAHHEEDDDDNGEKGGDPSASSGQVSTGNPSTGSENEADVTDLLNLVELELQETQTVKLF